MPAHWESSKRPLFVRTVVVNGSRHAILTAEDPLGQNLTQVRKISRPGSAQSSKSSSSENSTPSDLNFSENRLPFKERDISNRGPKDLQACLVKLRLVLASQESRKSGKSAGVVERGNKKRKKTNKGFGNKKTCGWQDPSENCQEPELTEDKVHSEETLKYDNNHNITIASYLASTPKINCSHTNREEEVDRISGHSELPHLEFDQNQVSYLGMTSEYDMSWNSVSAESYFTRPFYNRLSERVLQWLDLANKKKQKKEEIEEKTETRSQPKAIECKNDFKPPKRVSINRAMSEDNSEEVKSEEDVDTAMSRELPQFSQELNRLHHLKSTIPVKKEAYTSELQESIAQSFTTVVSIRSGKYVEKPTAKVSSLKPLQKGHLTRQVKLDESSEEETYSVDQKSIYRRRNEFLNRNSIFNNSKGLFGKQSSIEMNPLSQLSPHLQSRIPWIRDCKWPPEKEVGKPQLHIFIPAIPAENELFSDSASVSSDS